MNHEFSVVPEIAKQAESTFSAEGRYEAFDCGFSQGRFQTREAATKYAVRFWGGYVIDRETGERVV